MTSGNSLDAYVTEQVRMLRALERNKSLGLRTIAARAGVGKSSLDRYVSGDRGWPLDALDRVCRALGSSASVVLAAAERRRADLEVPPSGVSRSTWDEVPAAERLKLTDALPRNY